MKYHFIVNGYAKDWKKQMEELCSFKESFLSKLDEGTTILLCDGSSQFAEEKKQLTKQIIPLCAKHYMPELILKEMSTRMNNEDVYVFGSGLCGAELAVRAAARMNGSSAAGVYAFAAEETITIKKMVYSNHMEGAFRMKRAPYCIAISKGQERMELKEREIELKPEIWCQPEAEAIRAHRFHAEENQKGLADARVVIAAGRGAKKKENVELIREAAASLGAEFGVSRPAAMNAWAPMQRLIGVSGAMLAPEICIAAGISGAAAFYAGIEKSKFIAAINTDEKAPIVKKADVVIIDDFVPVLEELKHLAEK